MLVWNRKSPQSLSFEFEPWLYSDAHGVPGLPAHCPRVAAQHIESALLCVDPAVCPGQSTSPLICPSSRAAAAEWLSLLCLGLSCDGSVWLNDFPPQPHCHYVLLVGLLMKRESQLSPSGGRLHTLTAKPAGNPSPWLCRPTERERWRGRHVGQPNGNFLLVKKT